MCHVNFPDGKVIVFTYLHLLFLLIYLIKEVVRLTLMMNSLMRVGYSNWVIKKFSSVRF